MASDTPLSLGEFLRQEREKRGMTVEQVASATKIGVKQLHALESDQYGELPAKPFVRGFVTSYARFIGIDPREVLTRFNDFIERRSHDRPNREAGHSGYAFEKREGEQSRTILGIVMAVLVVLGIVFVILKPGIRHRRGGHVEKLRTAHSATPKADAVSPAPVAAPRVEPSPAAHSPAPSPVAKVAAVAPVPSPSLSPPLVASPSPEASPSPMTPPSPKPSPSPVADPLNSGVGLKPSEIKHKILFKALESTWVRYRADERPMMVFVLKKDKILVLRAESKVVVQIANPQTVIFNYNSQGYKSVAQSRNLVVRQNDSTLFFPSQLAETTQEPFPGERPLSMRPRPSSPTPAPSPSPTL